MGLDIVDEPVLILAHAEEVALLARRLGGAAAVRAEVALLELRGRPEGLAFGAVLALVGTFVDVALLVELFEDLLHGLDVALVGGADEVVVLDVHQLPQILGGGDDLIDKLLGRLAGLRGLALDLLAVLVRAGEEIGVVAKLLFEARHRVRGHGGVGVADVHVAAGVVDGRGDVERALFLHEISLLHSLRAAKRKRPSFRGALARGTTLLHMEDHASGQKTARAGNGTARRTLLPFAPAAQEPCSRAALPPACTLPGSLRGLASALLFPSSPLRPIIPGKGVSVNAGGAKNVIPRNPGINSSRHPALTDWRLTLIGGEKPLQRRRPFLLFYYTMRIGACQTVFSSSACAPSFSMAQMASAHSRRLRSSSHSIS